MKCELCHDKPAETVLKTVRNGEEDELYVCRACADAERVKRQKRSQRTRKASGTGGVSISVTSGEPPPFISAIFDAISGIVGEIEKDGKSDSKEETDREEPKYADVPVKGIRPDYLLLEHLHLEGLFLIGEMDAVRRAADALDLRLLGLDADGVRDAGHVYLLQRAETASADRATSFLKALVEQEKNARVRLFEEMPRVFGDSLCRALAILKNCRLLAPGELFDLLSPLRLAAIEGMLDGMSRRRLEDLLENVDVSGKENDLEPEERDRVDAERADEMNGVFEDVVLNERGEEKFL